MDFPGPPNSNTHGPNTPPPADRRPRPDDDQNQDAYPRPPVRPQYQWGNEQLGAELHADDQMVQLDQDAHLQNDIYAAAAAAAVVPLVAAQPVVQLSTELRDFLNGHRFQSVNHRRDDGQTPLLVAASACDFRHTDYATVVRDLLPHLGAEDINAVNHSGETALFHVVYADQDAGIWMHEQSRFPMLLDRMDEQGLNIQNDDGRTALSVLASGDEQVVWALLDRMNAAGINAPDRHGSTALMYAAFASTPDSVAQFVEFPVKVDFNAQNQEGLTALMLAAGRSTGRDIQILLRTLGVEEIMVRDENSLDTAAFNLPQERDALTYLDTVGHLLRIMNPLGIEATDQHGLDALMLAASTGNVHVVEMLRPHSNPFARSEHGLSALMLGAWSGSAEVVNELLAGLEEGWEDTIRETDSGGRNALMLGAWRGSVEVVEMLLDWLGDDAVPAIRATDNGGRNALMLGASIGSVEVVAELLDRLGDDAVHALGATDNGGRNALMLGKSSGSVEVVEMLTERMIAFGLAG